MSPVERLQDAIEKLEELRQATVDADGSMPRLVVKRYPQAPGWGDIVTVSSSPAVAAGWVPFDDAELFVTLHRTVDAQLAILRFGVQRLRAVAVLTGKHAEAHAHELALADAILGGA